MNRNDLLPFGISPDTIPRHLDDIISAIPEADYASHTYKVVMDRIKEFEAELDDEHEVALKLASFGQSITLSVSNIGYSNPSTLVFYGTVGNDSATLIQHMSQLNFLMLSVPKSEPDKPPRRIGFALPSDD